MDEVLKKALVLGDPESLFKEPAPPAPEPAFIPTGACRRREIPRLIEVSEQ